MTSGIKQEKCEGSNFGVNMEICKYKKLNSNYIQMSIILLLKNNNALKVKIYTPKAVLVNQANNKNGWIWLARKVGSLAFLYTGFEIVYDNRVGDL